MLILYFQSRASNIGKPVLCLLYNQAVSSNDCIITNNNPLKDHRWNTKEITITYFTSPDILVAGINELKSPNTESCPTVTPTFNTLKLPKCTLQLSQQFEQIKFPLPKVMFSLSNNRTSGAMILGNRLKDWWLRVPRQIPLGDYQ